VGLGIQGAQRLVRICWEWGDAISIRDAGHSFCLFEGISGIEREALVNATFHFPKSYT
jgi:hypothetical protein